MIPVSRKDQAVEPSLLCPANQLGQEMEHQNQLTATFHDSPFLHFETPVLTNVRGLALWSVRTVDCYS